jgi:NitT/TauT family transport system substrate-binding protein
MSRSRRVTRSALVAGLLLGAGLAACKPSPPEEPPGLRKLKVTSSHHLSWGPVWLAQEEGFFAEEGLEVELIHLPRPEESLMALLNGDVDATLGPLGPGLFTAMARGGAVRIVAGMNYLARDGCTYQGLVLRPGLTPARAAHRIRRLESSRDGSARYLTSRMLATRGIDIDTIETIQLPTAVIEHSLQTEAIDAAALTEPTLTRNSRRGTLWLRAQDATPDFQWGAVRFGARLLRTEREIGVRFLVAYRRGIERFNAGKTARTLEILERNTQEDREILEQSCWPAFRADARLNVESLLAYQQWAKQHGYLSETATAEQFWDSSFVVASDTAIARYHGLPPKE